MTLTDPGRPCSVCRGRLDAVASAIGRHPGCGAYRQVSDDALDLLVAHTSQRISAPSRWRPTKEMP